MLQHNPHAHTIRCAALNVTLDGHETRELSREDASAVPCVECDCKLMSVGRAKAKPADEK